jgi:hypothetical protein
VHASTGLIGAKQHVGHVAKQHYQQVALTGKKKKAKMRIDLFCAQDKRVFLANTCW